MFLGIDFAKFLSIFIQWWLGSDAKLAANFVARENLRYSYSLALSINLIGALSLYFPIRFGTQIYHFTLWVTPKEWEITLIFAVKRARVRGRFARLRLTGLIRKLKAKFGLDGDRFSQNNHEAVSGFIRRSRFTYGTIFVLNFLPIPIIGGFLLTTGSLFFIKTYGIRYGLFWVIAAKFSKVTTIATICYLYKPVASRLAFVLNLIEPVNIYWGPIWAYMIAAYGEFVLSYLIFLKRSRLT